MNMRRCVFYYKVVAAATTLWCVLNYQANIISVFPYGFPKPFSKLANYNNLMCRKV